MTTMTADRIPIGTGVGLQAPAPRRGRGHPPAAAWLEIHPENFLANPHATELLWSVRALSDFGAHGRCLHRQCPRDRPRIICGACAV